jgi:hypothetical protein
MATNSYTYIQKIRSELDDLDDPANEELLRYINLTRKELAKHTFAFEDTVSYSSTAYKYKYTLPTRMINHQAIIEIQFYEGTDLRRVDKVLPQEWLNKKANMDSGTDDTKYTHYIVEDDSLQFYPRLTTAAATTTLDGGITATSTTITVADSSSLPNEGRIIIDSEVIRYYNNDGTNEELENCDRGQEGTTAASHSDAATVTERDIIVKFYRYPTDLALYQTGTVTVSNAGQEVVGTGTKFDDYISTGWHFGAISTANNGIKEPTDADWYTLSSIQSDTSMLITSALKQASVTSVSYAAAEAESDVIVPFEDAVIKVAIQRAKLKDEEFNAAREFERQGLGEAKKMKSAMKKEEDEWPQIRDDEDDDFVP